MPRPLLTTKEVASRYAYTADTLAEAWGVSPATVRNLVRRKVLRAFKVGRQIRIRPEAVEEYEECQNGGSSYSEDTTLPSGRSTARASAGRLEPVISPLRGRD